MRQPKAHSCRLGMQGRGQRGARRYCLRTAATHLQLVALALHALRKQNRFLHAPEVRQDRPAANVGWPGREPRRLVSHPPVPLFPVLRLPGGPLRSWSCASAGHPALPCRFLLFHVHALQPHRPTPQTLPMHTHTPHRRQPPISSPRTCRPPSGASPSPPLASPPAPPSSGWWTGPGQSAAATAGGKARMNHSAKVGQAGGKASCQTSPGKAGRRAAVRLFVCGWGGPAGWQPLAAGQLVTTKPVTLDAHDT
jgi:hypothetical protein